MMNDLNNTRRKCEAIKYRCECVCVGSEVRRHSGRDSRKEAEMALSVTIIHIVFCSQIFGFIID